MTLQEIDVFLTVIRTGSVSEAAQLLYITQPAVSRHLDALEDELGCKLLIRKRGHRRIELTQHGKDFIPAAEKLRQSWKEALSISKQEVPRTLSVGCIGSLCTYLSTQMFLDFLSEEAGRGLEFLQFHSSQAYEAVANGDVDIAIISDDMYHPHVETIPLFREPMVLLAGHDSSLQGKIHPSQLDPSREIRLPWNPEYDLWHSFWFSSGAKPRIIVNQMALLEGAFSWKGVWGDSWAITPIIVARAISEKTGVRICELESGPPDEIIYYIVGPKRKPELTQSFLDCMKTELKLHPQIEIYT